MEMYETIKLHRAANEGDLVRLQKLLSRRSPQIDVHEPDFKDMTPLMYAVSSPDASVEVVRTLLRHGAEIDFATLRLALDNLEKLTLLIEVGADLHFRDEDGYDAVISTAFGRDVLHNPQLLDILRLLIAHGVSVTSISSYKESAVSVLSRIGRFDAVELLLKAGADPEYVKLTELMKVVAFGSLADVAAVVGRGPDLEERDRWERTAWLIAIQTGDIGKTNFLLEHGADIYACGRCAQPPLFYAIQNGHAQMLQWLLEMGMDVEQTDEFGQSALITAVDYWDEPCVDILLKAGANADYKGPSGTALYHACTRNIAMKLLEAGADPKHLTSQGYRAILNYHPDPDQDYVNVTAQEFRRNRTRRFGMQNPERMNNPFWEEMIRMGNNACFAAQQFEMENQSDGNYSPTWCARRFGQSITFLPDGRIVQVAGEHEDHYDPDFCIYNDVFVHSRDGSITIYGYPESVFPPTDFHTATLVGSVIYLIGSLGYPGTRQYGETPVYRLDTTTFRIERVQTTGNKPGWIYNHRAGLSAANEIRISGGKIVTWAKDKEVLSKNAQIFILDVKRRIWRAE